MAIHDSQLMLDIARRVLTLESDALLALSSRLDSSFITALDLLHDCKGKVIVSGLGKSGIAAKKISATLASTGTPALFLHSAEALHGDIGVMTSGDVLIAISFSGETHELIEMIPRARLLAVPVISLTGAPESSLAQQSDCHIDISVPKYEWPFGLLPTASNATTVAIGDALAVALLVGRGVKAEDFALLHPGGLLGRKLLVKVSDLMHSGESLPVVDVGATMQAAIMEMTAKRLGAVCVRRNGGSLAGIITDGDLRRLLEKSPNPLTLSVEEAMSRNPKTTTPDTLAAKALRQLEEHAITTLPVVSAANVLVGMIHLHDIVKLETKR